MEILSVNPAVSTLALVTTGAAMDGPLVEAMLMTASLLK